MKQKALKNLHELIDDCHSVLEFIFSGAELTSVKLGHASTGKTTHIKALRHGKPVSMTVFLNGGVEYTIEGNIINVVGGSLLMFHLFLANMGYTWNPMVNEVGLILENS